MVMRAMKTIRGSLTYTLAFGVALSGLVGCDAIDDAKKAAKAAAQLSETADDLQEASEEAEKAAEAAGKEAEKNVDPNASPEEKKQQVEMAKALGALGSLGDHAQGEGPVANWRQLAPFVPEELGSFSAKGELDGKTQSMGGIEVSNVSRRYEDGDRRATVRLTDTHFSTLLRAPFKMAAMVEEDSSKGYKKGKKIAGHTALVEWSRPSGRSKALLLVNDRYMLDIQVRGTKTPDDAEKVAAELDLDGLAKLEPKEE
jgi:hypothetical protein